MQNSGGAGDDEGEEADLALVAVLRKNRTVDGGFQTVVLFCFFFLFSCVFFFSLFLFSCFYVSSSVFDDGAAAVDGSATGASGGGLGSWRWLVVLFCVFCLPFISAPSCLLLPIFGFPKKNEKNTKNTHQKNIFGRNKKKIGVRKGCWNYHKMARNWLRRFRNTRIEIWQ